MNTGRYILRNGRCAFRLFARSCAGPYIYILKGDNLRGRCVEVTSASCGRSCVGFCRFMGVYIYMYGPEFGTEIFRVRAGLSIENKATVTAARVFSYLVKINEYTHARVCMLIGMQNRMGCTI